MEYQETSREAWLSFFPVSAELDRAIVGCIADAMPRGLADFELESLTGRKHESVSGNRRHLVQRGVVIDSGETTLNASGRRAILWILNIRFLENGGVLAEPDPEPKPAAEQATLFPDFLADRL